MSPVLFNNSKHTFGTFISVLQLKGYDYKVISEIAKQTEKYLQSNGDTRLESEHLQALQERWYESLKEGTPDYGVYECEHYLAEVWACWNKYSRTMLKRISKDKNGDGTSLLSIITPKNALDLGCGIGVSTSALKQLLPECDVYGTNLKNTHQWKIASFYANNYRWHLREDLPTTEMDLIFASEYFEHFEDPFTHLDEVINTCNPKVIVTANAFGTKAIGHFDYYQFEGSRLPASEMERLFKRKLLKMGYVMKKYGFWNNRPKVYWRKDLIVPKL